MPTEKFGSGESGFDREEEIVVNPGEKLKGFKKALWERTRAVFARLGLDSRSIDNEEMGRSAVEKIGEIRNKNEDDKFLDLDIVRGGENLNLRTIAQADSKYNPDRDKNYNEWDLTPQEEAERWLNREILVGKKLAKFTIGESVSADELVDADRNPKEGSTFFLKRTKEQRGAQDKYGEAEGRALTKVLLDMQTNLRATEMVKEIMTEEGIKTKLEMEQKLFEDYFDHFDGYMDNSNAILEELGNEGLANRLRERMEKFRGVIEGRQLGEAEYSFVHGNINFDSIKYSKDGKAYLSDWQRSGKTQNKELSLVYDLGNALQEAVEKLEPKQAEDFIKGVESEIRDYYKDQPEVAEAVINLTKLRSFAMIVNDVKDEKLALVIRGFGE